MALSKYNTFLEKIRYTKFYRFPAWFWHKYLGGKHSGEKLVHMRLGHKMWVIPRQPYLANVIISRQYHDENVFILKNFVSAGSVILDIGANIGLYACAYAQYFKNLNTKVYAIEAYKPNFDQLVKNIKLNGFHNITPFHLAFGDKTGELSMYAPSEDFVGNLSGANVLSARDLTEAKNKNYKKFVTPMLTLDQWAQEQNISRCDYLKIDIEGAEYFTFLGGRNFLEKTRPVIQCEFNMYWLNNIGISAQQFLDFFTPLNYTISLEEKNHYRPITSDEFIKLTKNAQAMFDVLFIPREKS